ncbi:MAG: type II CAAX prenyl endopeptidase Rce1 family protein [Polyangiaceae bacterium]|jgi:hypothetical protein
MGERRGPLADATKVVTSGLLFWGGAQLASTVFGRSETAAVAVQAAIAEWGAGTMGIAWSDPLLPSPSWRAIRVRVACGLGLGLAAAGVAVGTALATRAAAIQHAAPSVSALVVGLIVGALAAIRDELLLRGFALRATRGLLGTPTALAVCGGAAAAARLGLDGALTVAVVAEALRGIALGCLWVWDRGAWMAVAANVAWTWTTGPITHGGLFDLRFVMELDGSTPVVAVLAVMAGGAFFLVARRAANGTER